MISVWRPRSSSSMTKGAQTSSQHPVSFFGASARRRPAGEIDSDAIAASVQDRVERKLRRSNGFIIRSRGNWANAAAIGAPRYVKQSEIEMRDDPNQLSARIPGLGQTGAC